MTKFDFSIDPPLMNAAGILGFAPDVHAPLDLTQLGAFVTNPVSLKPRKPARGSRCLSFPGGFLLHTGYPNPGLRTVIRRYAALWKRASLPVIVHILCDSPAYVKKMVVELEEIQCLAGVELGLSPQVEHQTAVAMVDAAAGELPLIVRLPIERALELAFAIEKVSFIDAFSLGPPRGALPAPNGELVSGRLYGPAVYPLMFSALLALIDTGIPVIATGGIYESDQVWKLLSVGAIAVQLDTVIWRSGWDSKSGL